MSSEQYYPTPHPIEYSRTAIYYTPHVLDLVLYTSAIIRVTLYSSLYEILDVKMYRLIGDDYDKWQSDDYITQYVQEQLAKENLTVEELPLSPE